MRVSPSDGLQDVTRPLQSRLSALRTYFRTLQPQPLFWPALTALLQLDTQLTALKHRIPPPPPAPAPQQLLARSTDSGSLMSAVTPSPIPVSNPTLALTAPSGGAAASDGSGAGAGGGRAKRADRFSRASDAEKEEAPVSGFRWRVAGVTVSGWERREEFDDADDAAPKNKKVDDRTAVVRGDRQLCALCAPIHFHLIETVFLRCAQVYVINVRTTRGGRWVTQKPFPDFLALREALVCFFVCAVLWRCFLLCLSFGSHSVCR
jgi:hypothetical protein